MIPINVERMRELLCIDPTSPTGLSWKINRGKARAGTPAGSRTRTGYCTVKVDEQAYKAHRVVQALHTGTDPGKLVVDHIDGDRTNNHPDNLRAVTHSVNSSNRVQRAWIDWETRDGKHYLLLDGVEVGCFNVHAGADLRALEASGALAYLKLNR